MEAPIEVTPEMIVAPICHRQACGCPDCSDGKVNSSHFYAPLNAPDDKGR